ncbi:endonuclease V [Paractinoplanes deccanensis]|uniref:Endonuclease V n=1 Tax=Paractinoplanes deccanensis TaxID=113561 RepID=A0ABQ3YGV3_9ACTN|nr:endonuclease V [Actinoplanes deccanensis]GID79246.1 endonuclease V [Actinoplanes deccanensis]
MLPDEAVAVQESLRTRLVIPPPGFAVPPTVVGLDVTYTESSFGVAAAVVIDVATLAVVEAVTAQGEVSFPYVPGLLAFREIPLLREAISRLSATPALLICDGYGLAHPRRFGLASHLGVLLDVPAFGIAKTPYVGAWAPVDEPRGSWSDLVDGDEIVGRAVRTQTGVKPVFVSAGHRIALDDCTSLAVRLSGRYRIPEPTRQADILSRRRLADHLSAGGAEWQHGGHGGQPAAGGSR